MIDVNTYRTVLALITEHNELSARLHGLDTSLLQHSLLEAEGLYKLEHFATKEFVPIKIYERWGDAALMFMDVRMLWTADAVREYFNKRMFINFRDFQYRGFRPPSYIGGAELSQHRFGRALDFDIEKVSADEVRQEIITHPREPAFRYITVLESSVSWVHADCRLTNQEDIKIIQP